MNNLAEHKQPWPAGWLLIALAVCAFLIAGCKSEGSKNDNSGSNGDEASNRDAPPPDVVQRIVGSEELILELTPQVRWLAKSAMNLKVPDRRASKLFDDEVQVIGLSPEATKFDWVSQTPVMKKRFSLQPTASSVSRSNLNLFEPFLPSVDYFKHASFYFVHGSFDDNAMTRFESRMGCKGFGMNQSGQPIYFSGDLDVSWRKISGDGNDRWVITHWTVKRFDVKRAERLLFADVFSMVVRDLDVQDRATRSLHHEYFLRLLDGTLEDSERYETDYTVFFPDVTFEHPGVSVVDIDQDGWDDLYFCVMRGRNMLFRNRGDGTFEEVAANYGLDIQGGATSAAFADLDNDGDADLILGRGRRRAEYLVNEGNQFVDRSSELVDVPLPFLVSSSSVVDYNGDGLLDVYLCTYSPIEGGQGSAQKGNERWVELFMPEDHRETFKNNMRQAHAFMGMAGPPNVLLVNLGGGKFTTSPFNEQLEGWRKCFQSSWSDYDRDGDPDVYLSNDFSPDELYRNDGENGFTNVTKLMGVDTLGFGMGVSWGDYNNDEHIDLYASNMFSKAGTRITRQIPDLDPRMSAIARGNYLYEFDGSKFQLRSGTGNDKVPVANAGWSWGGQFTDFNNDTFADLYVASGYHTVPPEIAVDIDL